MRAHVLAVLDELAGLGASVQAMTDVGLGETGRLRFQPMLMARQIAVREQDWVHEQLRGGPPGPVTEVLMGYWFLLLQVELKTDALFAPIPAEPPDEAAAASGEAIGRLLALRPDVERLPGP
ncbi:MAG: hypothetical protein ACRDFR_03630 [Candidatus Limnocylindria bacterium]